MQRLAILLLLLPLLALAQPAIPGFTTLGIFGSHSYYQSQTAADWYTAENACVALGGHLACITSQAEQDFLASVTSGWCWIGFTDAGHEGIWT